MAQRNFYFDNLKGILVTLVVLFHLIPSNIELSLQIMYCFVFMFHMPFFILISGYFSKNREKQARKAFSLFFLYYILSLFLYIFHTQEVYIDIENIKNIEFSYKLFLQPFISHGYASWYLGVLLLLRIICPFFTNIKHYVGLSFVVGIIGSILEIDQYIIRRTLLMLPFFAVGYFLSKYKYEDLKKFFVSKVFALVGLFITFGIFLVFFYVLSKVDIEFIGSLFALGDIPLWDVFPRKIFLVLYDISYYFISFALMYFIACLVNNKESSFTTFGSNSLSIYFFHAFVTLPVRQHILKPLLRSGGADMIFAVVFISLAVTAVLVFLLSRDTFVKYTISPLDKLSKKFMINKN